MMDTDREETVESDDRYPFKVHSAPDIENNTVYSLTDNDCEPQSLEYMEDPYFIHLDPDATPSLDEVEAGFECGPDSWDPDRPTDLERDLRGLHLDLDDSMLCVETEFIMDNKKRRLRIFRKKMRDVRVTFQDLSKPYLAKISTQNNYKKFLKFGNEGDLLIKRNNSKVSYSDHIHI